MYLPQPQQSFQWPTQSATNPEGIYHLIYMYLSYIYVLERARLRSPIPADPGYGGDYRRIRYQFLIDT